MLVRVKSSGNNQNLQIVENYRQNGKVRQQVIATLGRADELIESGKTDKLVQSLVKFCKYASIVEKPRSDALQSEARYDGKYVLTTNLLPEELSTAEVASRCKELWQVEHIFRSMKSTLQTRPIYHQSGEAIRGYVFCSFLALILLKELQLHIWEF